MFKLARGYWGGNYMWIERMHDDLCAISEEQIILTEGGRRQLWWNARWWSIWRLHRREYLMQTFPMLVPAVCIMVGRSWQDTLQHTAKISLNSPSAAYGTKELVSASKASHVIMRHPSYILLAKEDQRVNDLYGNLIVGVRSEDERHQGSSDFQKKAPASAAFPSACFF